MSREGGSASRRRDWHAELKGWVALGLDPAQFWEQTFRTALVIVEGALARLDAEHNGRAWHAWHGEALHRSKRLPRLESLYSKPRTLRRQTTQDQMAICAAIARAYGGKVQ